MSPRNETKNDDNRGDFYLFELILMHFNILKNMLITEQDIKKVIRTELNCIYITF